MFGRCLAVSLTAAVVMTLSGCTSTTPAGPQPWRELFSRQELSRWQPAPGYEGSDPWIFQAGVYQGFGSWITHPDVFGDFDLRVDVLFSGQEQGGIVIRGDAGSKEPWTSGYELDVDWHPDNVRGHLHFPVKPKPYPGNVVIEPGKWHTITIRARGNHIALAVNGHPGFEFEDDEFREGNILLEGETGGVKFRNLRVSPILP